jgi:hypothetical protein
MCPSYPLCPSRLFLGLEFQREAVHAVPQPGRLGTVGENMPEMTTALRAMDLGPRHPVAAVDGCRDRVFPQRRPETGPSGSALELRLRQEQRLAAPGAPKRAGPLFLVQRTRSARLGAVLTQHVVLLGCQCSLGHDSVYFDFVNRPQRPRPETCCISERGERRVARASRETALAPQRGCRAGDPAGAGPSPG